MSDHRVAYTRTTALQSGPEVRVIAICACGHTEGAVGPTQRQARRAAKAQLFEAHLKPARLEKAGV